ncbi:hypothetical protein GCK32_018402 [Trichostrongylus colubriformis]|uniref:Uncharacterized protein n=1 Tax=Trichostrongylus colubriformis TaxID=6319 RepID=A0AAN8FLV7_TRICO
MERLIFALTVIGATLACSPVPAIPPDFTGKGPDIAHVHLISNYAYETSKVQEYMGYFPQTKIEEYSKTVGDFWGLESEDNGGFFSYTFYIAKCECEKIKLWMNAILSQSQYFKDAKVDCYILLPPNIGPPPLPPD